MMGGALNQVGSGDTSIFIGTNWDLDTGLSMPTHDQLGLVAGGVLGATIVENAGTVQMLLPQQDDSANPSLAFGDGDTGFYERVDDEIRVCIAGFGFYQMGMTWFGNASNQRSVMLRGSMTETTPGFTIVGDTNTGVGSDAATGDNLTLIAGGTASIKVDNDSTAGNTKMLVYDVDNATLERVSVGAADSGGSGYKVLRIPN